MKKIIYTLLFAFAASLTITACTEEEVTPVIADDNGGGGGSVGPIVRNPK